MGIVHQMHSNYFGGWSVIVDERRDVYRGGRGALGFPLAAIGVLRKKI